MSVEQPKYWREAESGIDKEPVVLQFEVTPDSTADILGLARMVWSAEAVALLRRLDAGNRNPSGARTVHLPYKTLCGAIATDFAEFWRGAVRARPDSGSASASTAACSEGSIHTSRS